jgi:hypothetical protein
VSPERVRAVSWFYSVNEKYERFAMT